MRSPTLTTLPPAYAWPGYAHMGPVTRYLMAGDSISTLFPQLRAKYQEARIPAATEGRIPVVLSLEGSVCPFDPQSPGSETIARVSSHRRG